MRDDIHGLLPVKVMRELSGDEIDHVAGGILENGVGPTPSAGIMMLLYFIATTP
jgi:hypothetical protein